MKRPFHVLGLMALAVGAAALARPIPPGLGDQPGVPGGAPWTPIDGLEVIAIQGMGDDGCVVPEGITDLGQVGMGRAALCLRLKNRTDKSLPLGLVGGLVFISADRGQQNAVSLERPAPGTLLCPQEEVVVTLAAYCLNSGRAWPEKGARYGQARLTDIVQLQQIATAAQGKDLTAMDSSIQGFLDRFERGGADARDLAELLAEIQAQPNAGPAKARHCVKPRG